MDPFTIWLVCLATAWFLRAAVEDGIAQLRGQESPRIARRRERQDLALQYVAATGQPRIGQAVAGRIAQWIANPRREIGPARQYLAGLWEDSWEDAATRHEERRRKREERRREQAEREAAGRPDPDNALRTRLCLGGCGVLVVEPREWCDACTSAQPDDQPEQPEQRPDSGVVVHYCAGGCGQQVGDPGYWCAGCRYYRGPECSDGCGNKVAISGQRCAMCSREHDGPWFCGNSCGRAVPERAAWCPACTADLAPPVDANDLDDDQIDDLNDQPTETPEPNPVPDTNRKETPAVTNPTEINGDVTDPLTSLAYATGCLDTNSQLMNEVDAMANNLTGEGVGAEVVQIVRDAWAAGEQFGLAALGARDEFARHVATQADIAGNTELRDTVRDTYLDSSRA